MSEHLQRLARGTPRVCAGLAKAASDNPPVLIVFGLLLLFAAPFAVAAFVAAAYLYGDEKRP